MSKEKSLVLIAFVVAILGVVWFVYVGVFAPSDLTETKTLTILHAWEEGGQYYFADELGCVYLIAYKGDLRPKREIRYDDMPKIRFEKLKEGHRYNVEYVVRQGDVRWSLREKEMKR